MIGALLINSDISLATCSVIGAGLINYQSCSVIGARLINFDIRANINRFVHKYTVLCCMVGELYETLE